MPRRPAASSAAASCPGRLLRARARRAPAVRSRGRRRSPSAGARSHPPHSQSSRHLRATDRRRSCPRGASASHTRCAWAGSTWRVGRDRRPSARRLARCPETSRVRERRRRGPGASTTTQCIRRSTPNRARLSVASPEDERHGTGRNGTCAEDSHAAMCAASRTGARIATAKLRSTSRTTACGWQGTTEAWHLRRERPPCP